MSILSTYGFDPTLTEALTESFEQAGIAPKTIGEDHLDSAFRSIKFMLNSEWSNLGVRQWMIVQTQQATTFGMTTFDLPQGAIDILSGCVLRRDARDTIMNRIGRDDYLGIADKSLTGRPDRYFADRRRDKVTIYIWRRGENTTDLIIYNYFRQLSDVGKMSNTLDMPTQMMHAFICGLSARLAQKFNKPLYAQLQTAYRGPSTEKIGGALQEAMQENRERADVYLTVRTRR